MTSANVTSYIIYNKGTDNEAGKHSEHAYCKPRWNNLLRFDPPENYEIYTWWLDEEEEYYDHPRENLKDFLIKRRILKIEQSS